MIEANGLPVISLRLTLPVSGLWVASVECISEEALSGAIELTQADTNVSYLGYAVRSGTLGGSCLMTVVGGRGGLTLDVTAKSYRNVSVKTFLAETLEGVGERLAASSSPELMSTQLPFWTRTAGRTTLALSALTRELDARWRVLPSGDVWVGVDSFAPSNPEVLELDRDFEAESVLVDADDMGLVPGVTVNGDRVGRVEHSFGRDDAPATTYWIEAT